MRRSVSRSTLRSMRAGAVVFWVLLAACAGKSNNVGRGATGASGDGAGGDGAGGDGAGGNASGGKGGKGGKGGMPGSGGQSSGATGGDSPGTGGDGISQGGEGASTGETGGSGGTGGDSSMSGGTGGDGMATGGTGGSPNVGGSAGMEQPPITSCTEDFGFLGTWEGNVLDFFFEPIDTVRLVITEDPESGLITGTVTFGEGDPPPPPESADIPYPPGFWDDPFSASVTAEPWPGKPYTVVRGAGCDATLRFGFATTELFDDWCGMMEPVYTPDFGWGCTLQGSGQGNAEICTMMTNEGVSATYPMWKCAACGYAGQRVCSCEESGCFASTEPDHLYNLALVDGVGSSILSGPDSSCPDCTIRLERME